MEEKCNGAEDGYYTGTLRPGAQHEGKNSSEKCLMFTIFYLQFVYVR